MSKRVVIIPDSQWKSLPKYPGIEFSDEGEARSYLKSGAGSKSLRREPLTLRGTTDPDGYIRLNVKDSNGVRKMLYVCREKLREDLQILAASNGLRASSTEYRPGHFRLNVCSRVLSGVYRKDAEQVDYDGEVWCLRVPNERFFVEREGLIHLTGNSRPRDYLAKYAPALAKSGEFNLDKLLDFQQYNFTLLPDFYQVAPGWLTTHGHRGGIRLTQKAGQTALGAAIRFGQSVVMGHTHRLAAASHSYGVGNNVSTLWGIEVGNLMDYRKAQYLNGAAPNWQKGFVILDVARTKVQPTLVDMKGRSFQVDGKEYEVV